MTDNPWKGIVGAPRSEFWAVTTRLGCPTKIVEDPATRRLAIFPKKQQAEACVASFEPEMRACLAVEEVAIASVKGLISYGHSNAAPIGHV